MRKVVLTFLCALLVEEKSDTTAKSEEKWNEVRTGRVGEFVCCLFQHGGPSRAANGLLAKTRPLKVGGSLEENGGGEVVKKALSGADQDHG